MNEQRSAENEFDKIISRLKSFSVATGNVYILIVPFGVLFLSIYLFKNGFPFPMLSVGTTSLILIVSSVTMFFAILFVTFIFCSHIIFDEHDQHMLNLLKNKCKNSSNILFYMLLSMSFLALVVSVSMFFMFNEYTIICLLFIIFPILVIIIHHYYIYTIIKNKTGDRLYFIAMVFLYNLISFLNFIFVPSVISLFKIQHITTNLKSKLHICLFSLVFILIHAFIEAGPLKLKKYFVLFFLICMIIVEPYRSFFTMNALKFLGYGGNIPILLTEKNQHGDILFEKKACLILRTGDEIMYVEDVDTCGDRFKQWKFGEGKKVVVQNTGTIKDITPIEQIKQ